MRWFLCFVVFFMLLSLYSLSLAGASDIEIIPSTSQELEETNATMPDPIEPVNRAIFNLNDKLYYWVLRPTAKGYAKVVPEQVRRSIDNFLHNLSTPVRMANDLLQLKFKKFIIEFARFLANTTIGIAGLFDPAEKWFNLPRDDEDFGQTLGTYGVGEISYIEWPVLGPSCVRDSTGEIVDSFLDPVYYIVSTWTYAGIYALRKFNEFSFDPDRYDEIKQDSFDPYISVRNMYFQYRRKLIEE
ncbi:lipoprotein [Thermosulfidibacter takaii ABI70S6]|uniref:Lipoprotein n=1 Tax=Thermosulfidibacter takaii (strain DSM 17441 / JCM 13301 / NBRC 103674 / ABI70S6) TaxID=1298851 RepID=A0A0S3QSE5_THET7|nr:VacJ family lipoprotein [Thermosulfidibacter takaii]BAT71241.1 lipoprotein [Thermosulfidibacter takaii ABI70S6]